MNQKKITIIIITVLSVFIIPLIVAGFLVLVVGRILGCIGYMLMMQPHVAKQELRSIIENLKELWRNN